MSTKNEEIDIAGIIETFKKFVDSSIVFILRVIGFALRNWIILLILILVGATAGYFHQKGIKKSKESKLILKTNFDTVTYLYNALETLSSKSSDKNKGFLRAHGFRTDTVEIQGVNVEPLIDLRDIVTHYELNEDRTLGYLLSNLRFEDESKITESFKSDYKLHKVIIELSPEANEDVIDKIIAYLNSDPNIKRLQEVGKKNLARSVSLHKETIDQIDTILNNYHKTESLGNASSQLFVVDKNFSLSEVLRIKSELQKEYITLSQELVYADQAIIQINPKSIYRLPGGILSKKMYLYPFLLVTLFFAFHFFRYSYKRLRKKYILNT